MVSGEERKLHSSIAFSWFEECKTATRLKNVALSPILQVDPQGLLSRQHVISFNQLVLGASSEISAKQSWATEITTTTASKSNVFPYWTSQRNITPRLYLRADAELPLPLLSSVFQE